MIVEKSLSKGNLRKLTALRKSLGNKIANEAFEKWYAGQKAAEPETDQNAILLTDVVNKLIKKKPKFSMPQSGFLITRGRGRVKIIAAPKKAGRKAARKKAAPAKPARANEQPSAS